MTTKEHDIFDNEFIVPDEEYYTHTDPHFKDHTIPEHFTKNTGIEIKDIPAFCIKELMDNSADFVERHHYLDSNSNNGEDIITTYLNEWDDPTLTISVANYNHKNIPFPSLPRIYDYNHSLSSKAQQYRITRGAQGDALKQLGTAGYLMNGGNDWKYPIVFEHNQKEDTVYIEIDRKYNKILPRFENRNGTFSATDTIKTKVTLTLPKISTDNFLHMIEFWKQYTLFNTHLSYSLHFGPSDSSVSPPAQLPISRDYKNPTTVYAYTPTELEILLNDSADKDITAYDALKQIGFRELNQPNRFNDLKKITLKELKPEQVKDIHKRLSKSMEPMSRLARPYHGTSNSRKLALLKRYNQIKPSGLKIDLDGAVYKTSSPNSLKDNIYKDAKKGTQYVYYFEVIMIPIRDRNADNIIISGVNFSTSITDRQYFSGQFANTYRWRHDNGEDLQAGDIDEIIRKSMAGKDIGDIESIDSKRVKMPCVIIAHLVSQKIDYRGGYGKSQLILDPFQEEIAKTIERAVKCVPTKEKYYPSSKLKPPSIIGLLEDLLVERWRSVCSNPEILNPYNTLYYDPWSQSTVWYHFTEEKIKPIESDPRYDHSKPLITKSTRAYVTSKISEICEERRDKNGNLLIGVPREKLGIFASARAQFYFKGGWHSVYLDDIPALADKGTVVIFIEKVGVVDQIKHIIDKYGIAFVNTQGHFAEYPKSLVLEIIKKGGYVAILTDFDCAGIHIAERVIMQVLNELGEEGKKKIVRLGVDIQMLEYFVSKGVKNREDNFMTLDEFKSMIDEPYLWLRKKIKKNHN
jgi:hypothetical protein